jgi:hypothetical protein
LHLHAPRPVAVVGGVLKEHGFGAGDADPLEYALFDAAGKELVSGTIGSDADGAASVYLWNSITQDVIKVPAAMYRPFKDGPEAFRPKAK